jgi:hypothetical protein
VATAPRGTQVSEVDELSTGEKGFWPGLPDGLFSNQKSHLFKKFRGLRLENVDIFNGNLQYFVNNWDIS